MAGYVTDIEEKTETNEYFRQVLFTGKHSQLVVMTLQPGEDIGMEVHPNVDQFFRIEEGHGKVIIDGEESEIKDGTAIVIPAGAEHNIINTGEETLRLYTIYSPPNHLDGTIHKDKAEAMAAEEVERHTS
ncbi:MAG: cupin domain-containing protein [Patescibacteria group bacterium]|jgi:mannose-6-phosphate isomerase-like protein (cupin superfamily)